MNEKLLQIAINGLNHEKSILAGWLPICDRNKEIDIRSRMREIDLQIAKLSSSWVYETVKPPQDDREFEEFEDMNSQGMISGWRSCRGMMDIKAKNAGIIPKQE